MKQQISMSYKMKTIYIFAPFDAIPGEAGSPARFEALKEALEAQGHTCIWWTSIWSHVKKSRRPSISKATGIRLLPSPAYGQNVSLKRIRNHRALARAYVTEVTRSIEAGEIPAPDMQLFSLPPLDSAAACLKIKKRFRGKVVLDVMDIWPNTFYQMLPFVPVCLRDIFGRIVFYPFYRQACYAAKHCDALTAQSRSFVDWAKGLGFRDKPEHVCYLGADVPPSVVLRERLPDQPLRLAYIGMMGMSYDLETLVQAIRDLVVEGHSVTLDIAGTGPKEAALRKWVCLNHLEEIVRFHGYLDKSQLFKILESCHLGMVPMYPESGVTVPYKACEYSCQGLGMIHSLPGELEALVDQYQAGTIYSVGNVDSLKGTIATYLNDAEQVVRHSSGAMELAAERFDRSHTYQAFASFLADLADSAT